MATEVIQESVLRAVAESRRHLRTASLFVTGDLSKGQKKVMLRRLYRARRYLNTAINQLEKLEAVSR